MRHLEKRVSGTGRKLQLPKNDSLGKILFLHLLLLPLVLQPLYLTLSHLCAHYSLFRMMDRLMKNASQAFAISQVLAYLQSFCTDWYFDTDAQPCSLSRDLSMNNISKIQSRAFHRLHLLSELWVKSFSQHSIDQPPSEQLTHDKKQLFPELLISSMMGIDDFGLCLISPAKKQPAAIAKGSWDGCTQKGCGVEPDSHSESKYMVLKVLREQVMHSDSKPLLSLTLFQLDSSAGAVHT